MIKTKVAFLEGRLFFNQSGLFENSSDCSDWLDKSRPSKKPFLFLSCKQANIALQKKVTLQTQARKPRI